MSDLDAQRLATVRAWAVEKALDFAYDAKFFGTTGASDACTAGAASASEAYASVVRYIDHVMRVGAELPHVPYLDGN